MFGRSRVVRFTYLWRLDCLSVLCCCYSAQEISVKARPESKVYHIFSPPSTSCQLILILTIPHMHSSGTLRHLLRSLQCTDAQVLGTVVLSPSLHCCSLKACLLDGTWHMIIFTATMSFAIARQRPRVHKKCKGCMGASGNT